MKQTGSRRSILSAIGTGIFAVLAGCTDRSFERTQIFVENAHTREHRVRVWVVVGGDLTVAESVNVDSGSEAELSEQLRAPLSEKRYRLTVQLDPREEPSTKQMNPAYATSFTYDEGFERLQIVVGEDGDMTADPLDGV